MNLESLIKDCIRQKSKAQEELYNRYKDILFVLSLKYCSNEAEAEDNLHNAFIEIFTNIKKYNGSGSFEGWIKRITINKAIDSYKKSYQMVPIKDDFQDTLIEEKEIDFSLDTILSLIQELPTQYRLVFSLYELDDYSHKEIAQMLEISENTSKSNLHRAKTILKEKIKQKNSFHNNYNISNGE
ncbi:RNA polymerase sigma-70 factor (ECF subfamily) [Flavobacterium gossypii]|uniref:RNA polymerase sigma-70 factor (ECF subfamily) n=1 Tax=Flavobacterium gossypii TaxID=1646119 RepID=A0ABR6DM81_9FLAO|nr:MULTISPECIES: sigma-70 family RNA polymerase sigma factor [Flavobacterium]MBA9072790.1 RNA polymerase sigma-70 factor (ECF subfamily) [Flavobacterium gossypii]WDO13258.1 sigma-70 family RNA polymerase sigma factor [Flavobacterium sp. WW92]